MNQENLKEILGVSDEELFEKYQTYEKSISELQENGCISDIVFPLAAGKVFEIDLKNTPAVFFLVVGLMAFQAQINFNHGGNG